MTSPSFSAWLLDVLEGRDWSQADLSRRCKISPAQISRILSGSRRVGLEVCLKLAVGLKLPVDLVYQKAGLLPENPESDETFEELKRLYQSLPEGEREELLLIARHRAERTKKG